MIAPARDGLLEVYEVSPAVNRVANDNPALIEPASAAPEVPAPVKAKASADRKASQKRKTDDGQGSLF